MADSTRLTKRAIDSFKHRGGMDIRWDGLFPGFGVRVYPSGRKAFVLSYRLHSTKHLMVIGSYGELTLDQARDRARRRRVEIRDGNDPLRERQKTAQGSTFNDLIDAYLDRHAKPHKKTWQTDVGRLERHVPKSWRGRNLASISREEISGVHSRIGATHSYEANRFLDLLRLMFRLAKLWYFIDPSADNPAEGIQKFKEHKRKRWITPKELPRLAEAIDSEPNVYVRAVLWLYLLTGARKTELLQAEWNDVDWDRMTLRLSDTKSGDEQRLVLSGPAVAILQSIPKLPDNPFILPGARPGRHLVNIDKCWRRIRKAAALEDVRLHDLRRSTGSWFAMAGVDLNRIKDALRHANVSTTLVYARLGEDATRDAFEDHGRRVMEAAGKRVSLGTAEPSE